MMLLTLIMTPENGDIYEKELFKGKQSFVYSVLVTSLQAEKRERIGQRI